MDRTLVDLDMVRPFYPVQGALRLEKLGLKR